MFGPLLARWGVGVSMAGETNKLSALACRSLSEGKHFDGGGLYLHVMSNDSRLWRMKYHHDGAERLLTRAPKGMNTRHCGK